MGEDTRQDSTPKEKLPLWCSAFIECYRETGNVMLAAKAAGINRTTAYFCRKQYAEFAEMWENARDDAADRLEQEALRRAHDGVQRLQFYKGAPIMVPAVNEDGTPRRGKDGEYELVPYIEHEYSDTLLMFLLKGSRPEKFRENLNIEQSGGVRKEIVIEVVRAPDSPTVVQAASSTS